MAPLTIPKTSTLPPVVLFGQPNVGKSALFAALTGARAIVSNYPGTTVDVSRGRCEIAGAVYPVHDTPGAYSLLPVSDEERIARDSLFAGEISTLLHIVDAKNLDRSLGTTLELLDAGLPVVLVLNMSRRGRGGRHPHRRREARRAPRMRGRADRRDPSSRHRRRAARDHRPCGAAAGGARRGRQALGRGARPGRGHPRGRACARRRPAEGMAPMTAAALAIRWQQGGSAGRRVLARRAAGRA
jgi:small GTP-binding protein